MPIFVSDTPLSPMGPSSPSQEGLFTDLRLLSLEKQLNIELKVDIVSSEKKKKKKRKNTRGENIIIIAYNRHDYNLVL